MPVLKSRKREGIVRHRQSGLPERIRGIAVFQLQQFRFNVLGGKAPHKTGGEPPRNRYLFSVHRHAVYARAVGISGLLPHGETQPHFHRALGGVIKGVFRRNARVGPVFFVRLRKTADLKGKVFPQHLHRAARLG